MRNDFPFTIKDVARILNLQYRNSKNLDVNCPFCNDKKGKMNLNDKKNVFRCNRCGENGGMLALYGKIQGVDGQTAYSEIRQALALNMQVPNHNVLRKEFDIKSREVINVPIVSEHVINHTYTMLLSFLTLTETHKKNLLLRGLSEEQIGDYKSTPVFGFRELTKRLIENNCIVEGVPGFYQEKGGEWNVHFNPKSSGYLIPIKNTNALIIGMQIRLDRPMDGRKYIWFSSANNHMGVSSGSPIHFVGELGSEIIFMTEGALKGNIAYALSNRTFVCVPGVNQYKGLYTMLQQMQSCGTRQVYDAYDMDKLMNINCDGHYSRNCVRCDLYSNRERNNIICPQKKIKRDNVQRGCTKLKEICDNLHLKHKLLTWDTDASGNWAGNNKGVDDYLKALRDNIKNAELV